MPFVLIYFLRWVGGDKNIGTHISYWYSSLAYLHLTYAHEFVKHWVFIENFLILLNAFGFEIDSAEVFL